MSDWTALREWCERVAGLPLGPRQMEQLQAYVDVLLLWNRKFSLVSQSDARVIRSKHVADSLFLAAQCVGVSAVLDLGSGAGFPGIPIAIAVPSAHVGLVESRAKKASFLSEARRITGLSNVVVHQARIESLSANRAQRARYDRVTARALTSLDEFLELAGPFLAPGGEAIAMRSVNESLAVDLLGRARVVPYELPDGSPRRLVIVGR